MAGEIQAILFDKSNWDLPMAKRWVREHGFRPRKEVHETRKFFRFRLQNPDKYSRLRTKVLSDGIEFVIGYK